MEGLKHNMKIRRITIKNFRSIENAFFEVSDFNVFIGKNNCGKTNIFEAIDFFYNGKPKTTDILELTYNRQKVDVVIEIEFVGAQNGLTNMSNEKNKTTITKLLNANDTVVVRRTNDKREIIIDGHPQASGTGFDAALNDFLPKFEYVSTKQYYDSVAKYTTNTPMGKMLTGVLSIILEGDKQYQDLQNGLQNIFTTNDSEIGTAINDLGVQICAKLKLQFPECQEVQLSVPKLDFKELLKNLDISINDGCNTSAEEKGDGTQRALMFAIIQVYADFRKKCENVKKSLLFFIDEAELHLHPTAQRALKSILYELSDNTDQVFINTHSSVFIADSMDKQVIFKVEKEGLSTVVEKVDENNKQYVVYDLLGGSPSDLLLPRNFLIVEGKSEVELFTRVIQRFYNDKSTITVIPAHGDSNECQRSMSAVIKVWDTLKGSIYKNKIVVLLDQPNAKQRSSYDEFKNNNNDMVTEGRLFTLSECAIEQCYPESWQPKNMVKMECAGKKIKLAKTVGDGITQEQFESGTMKQCYDALCKAWDLAY